MNRYRKKARLDIKQQPMIVLVNEETDQQQEERVLSKKIKDNDKDQSCCGSCNNYQKIKEIPQYTLTKAQMKGDPIELILKLQHKFKDYGAVKIRSCPEWNPSFNFKYTEKGITVRIQKIHRLKQGKAFEEKKEQYNIKSFTNFAEDYQKNYRFKFQRKGCSLESQTENQYWKIVNGVDLPDAKLPDKYKATVQYAADLPSHIYGSGFPQFASSKSSDENFDYATSYFNLNNVYKSPNSILNISDKNSQKISGVTIPWIYMGMQFSSFCWHVEDLWLNSLNYSHKGATKTWYIIPQSDKQKFDAFVLKKTGKRQLLNSITFMIDPIQLINNGIKIYKAYQRPREYILTLFNAYHCGFSQGFNVGEAVNVVTVDSFNIIKKAQNYNVISKKNHKPPVLCYDWLVAANVGNSTINQQLIISEYNQIVKQEYGKLRKFVEKAQIVKVDYVDSHLKYDRLSCQTCRYYQFLSVLKCSQCEKRYCIDHAEKCCGKGFIFFTRETDKYRIKTIDFALSKLK